MLLTSILLAVPALPSSPPLPAPHGDLRITEFLADNNGGHLDEDGADSDWIEIANVGVAAADLAGWHLTDDLGNLTKWTFPTQALAPGARIVVFASDKDRAVPGSELHTNFKLTASGEPLALVQPDLTISSAYQPTFPQQLENVSYGLRDSAAEEGYFSPPTPGAPNGDIFASLSPVEFSEPRGLKSAPFSLVLSHPEPGAALVYTLDGDDPSVSGTPYSAPIPINSTTIVRAVATKPAHVDSPPITFSYLFPADVLIQSDSSAIAKGFHPQWIEDDGTNWNLGGTRPGAWYGMDQVVLGQHTNQELLDGLASLPSISLTLPEEDWFGNGDVGETPGIYCNSFDAGDFWDRPGSAEWMDPSGGPEFHVNCGIAIQGGSSTNLAIRNQLSIAMKFREELGVSKLDFAPFEDRGLSEYDLLILDAGSQLSPNGPAGANQKVHAMGLRDQFMANLQHEFGSLSPAGTFVHLYLNGLYWGVYNLHERIDDNHSSAYQGGAPEEYDWIREGQVREGNGNDWDEPQPGLWDTAVEITKNGVTPGDLWQGQDAYTALSEVFDVADYADYLILNYYGGNTDWPQNNWMGTIHARNSADWSDVNLDGMFRWHSWDAETVMYWGGSETAVGDGFYDRTALTATWEGNAVFFYTNLRHNPEWRMLFADRAHQHLFHGALYVDPAYAQAGTPFDPEHPERNRPAATFHRLTELTEPAIALEWARWGNYWDSPGTYDTSNWLTEKQRLLEDFFPIRSGVLLAQLRNVQPQLYPDLDAPVFTPAGGAIKKNATVSLSVPGGSTVYYTLDGQDPRLVGGAVNPTATTYAGPFTLPGPTTTVKARAFDGNEWSALEVQGFAVGVKIRLNEILAENDSGILDEAGQNEDWIEIINTGQNPVNLRGWGLSDDPNDPGKWRFPNGTVLAGGSRLLVFCDKDPLDGPYHASFRIQNGGETIILTGGLLDGDVPVDQTTFRRLGPDTAWARIPDGRGDFQGTGKPTPLDVNLPGDRTWQ